jgi:TetR/AcrR family transcriptional regulator, transcriptional repressor for nem operon
MQHERGRDRIEQLRVIYRENHRAAVSLIAKRLAASPHQLERLVGPDILGDHRGERRERDGRRAARGLGPKHQCPALLRECDRLARQPRLARPRRRADHRASGRRVNRASPSPRRLTRKGQETRQRIVSAAADLIFERGVAHTTIEDVRATADVSSSQLYHYFDDKAALVSAVIEHQADAIVSNHERLDLSTLEGLRAWRDWVVDYQRSIDYRGGCPIGSLGSELADTDPEARAQVAKGFKRWETAIQSGLREMHAHGRLAPDADPDSLALALLTALQGGLLLAKIERNTKPLEAALDSILQLVARLGDAAAAKTSVGPR